MANQNSSFWVALYVEVSFLKHISHLSFFLNFNVFKLNIDYVLKGCIITEEIAVYRSNYYINSFLRLETQCVRLILAQQNLYDLYV
jgi:hypothetical protein